MKNIFRNNCWSTDQGTKLINNSMFKVPHSTVMFTPVMLHVQRTEANRHR